MVIIRNTEISFDLNALDLKKTSYMIVNLRIYEIKTFVHFHVGLTVGYISSDNFVKACCLVKNKSSDFI
jgi:hypothetical protein